MTTSTGSEINNHQLLIYYSSTSVSPHIVHVTVARHIILAVDHPDGIILGCAKVTGCDGLPAQW